MCNQLLYKRIGQKKISFCNLKLPNNGAPLIYTERKDGVLPAYDIRTDKMALAQEAMEKNMKAVNAKRQLEYDIMVNGEKKNAESGNKEVNSDMAGATEASA